MPAIPELRSPRLRLRAPDLGDLPHCLALWRHESVYRHITGHPATQEEAWARLLRYRGHWTLLGYGFWVVESIDTGAYLGELGLSTYHRGISPELDAMPEIGWVLAPEAHGQGYGTEAARAALAWRDTALPPGPTFCIIAPENIPSLKLAARLGFVARERTEYHGHATVVLVRK